MKSFFLKAALLIIPFCLFLLSCPALETKLTGTVSGVFQLSSQIRALQYPVRNVRAYSMFGTLLASAVPTNNDGLYEWKMQTVIEEGTPVTLWVEFLDRATGTTYFDKGQEEVITKGNEYDWIVSDIYIPIFSEDDLRNIGKDRKFNPREQFILVADIALTKNWEPLCPDENSPFTGVFDGNNHTISGLKFQGGGTQHIGFFGCTKQNIHGIQPKNAALRNLKLIIDDTNIEFGILNTQNFGILVANAEYTDIEKVTIEGRVDALTLKKTGGAEFNVGGIAGNLAGKSSIKQTASHIPLLVSMGLSGATKTVTVNGGGLAGKVGETYLSNNNPQPSKISLSESYVPSNFSVALSDVAAQSDQNIFAGGLIGGISNADSEITIEESYFSGNISVSNGWQGRVGGLIGGGSGDADKLTIIRSISLAPTIDVVFRSASGYFIGRLAGQSSSASHCYAATPAKFENLPQSLASTITAGTPKQRTLIDMRWFEDRTTYAGLQWNFSSIWLWSPVKNMPGFQWE